MANAALLLLDLGLTATGYGDYTLTGALTDLIGVKRNKQPKSLTPEDVAFFEELNANARFRRENEKYYKDLVAEERQRVQKTKDALKNRRVDISKLPTTTDLRKIDTSRLQKQGVPIARIVAEDPLADTKIQMEKINNDALTRNRLQEIRMKEARENADEERSKILARRNQLEGSINLLSQIQKRTSSDSANLQQIRLQQQNLIQKTQADVDAANAAVIKAEQEQQAKNSSIPAMRLPPSVKYGGSRHKSILKRLMAESDMTLKEAKKYIKIYGI
nr:MAG: hypothetical protein [Lake Baikal virophage 11]